MNLPHKKLIQPDIKEDEADIALFLLRIHNLVSRSIKLLIISVLFGLIAGALYYFNARRVFETTLIASSRTLTNLRVENLVNVLDKLAQEQNIVLLAKKLSVSQELAKNINSIEVHNIVDPKERKPDNKTIELDDNVFEITLRIYNNQLLDSLQVGILYYLQNNDFVEKRIAIQKQNLEIMRERVKEEVKKLDSLRFSVNKLLNKGVGNNSTMLMSDPASVNKDIMALYERELTINSELLLIDDIQVIQDFTQFDKPSSPKLLKSVAASTGSAVTLALIIIAILEAQRGMRKLKQELEQKVTKEKEFV